MFIDLRGKKKGVGEEERETEEKKKKETKVSIRDRNINQPGTSHICPSWDRICNLDMFPD